MPEANIIAETGFGTRWRTESRRYTATAQWIHWLTALMMAAILPIAWHMTMLARDDPQRETWYTVHKSLGLTILALSVVRLAWRAANPPPRLPGAMNAIERGLAHASHWALYVALFAMPISGYTISAAGGHPVSFFGLFFVPSVLPTDPALAKAGVAVHLLGQWAVYALIALHLAATGWHVVQRRDGLLDRMLPEQDGVV